MNILRNTESTDNELSMCERTVAMESSSVMSSGKKLTMLKSSIWGQSDSVRYARARHGVNAQGRTSWPIAELRAWNFGFVCSLTESTSNVGSGSRYL
jgi:hypothetical protein